MADSTVVVYFGDHGANNLVRHKQMPTEGGLHVPFIIAGPSPFVPSPSVRDDLVDMLDLSATTLAWAGVKKPHWYEGQDLFGEIVIPRSFVAAAKDRLDHTIDRVRTVRTDRFRYTRNYKTDRIFLQPQYRDDRPFLQNLHQLYQSGNLPEKLTEIYFCDRPAEEFYEVSIDPSQVNNLIDDPKFADEIERHRSLLDDWLAKGDEGVGEESDEELRFQGTGKKWGEGVNPEYEVVRSDSDGDGLSDDWERINGRNALDGRAVFQFDCGGWQTEGWKATEDSVGNIAGRLGYLDFSLPNGKAVILRDGLKLDPAKNRGALKVKLRSAPGTKVTLSAGGSASDATTVESDQQTIEFPIDWHETVTRIELQFEGQPGSVVEIDSIEVSPH